MTETGHRHHLRGLRSMTDETLASFYSGAVVSAFGTASTDTHYAGNHDWLCAVATVMDERGLSR